MFHIHIEPENLLQTCSQKKWVLPAVVIS